MKFVIMLFASSLWNTIYMQRIKSNEDFEHMQHIPKEQFAAVADVIKSGEREYPCAIVSGVAVVTTPDARNPNGVSFCLLHDKEEKCIPAIGDLIVDKENKVAYMKIFLHPFYSKELEKMTYKGDLADVNVCVAVSYIHDPILMKMRGSTVMECLACAFLDAVVCDLRYVGILLENKQLLRYDDMLAFTIQNIGDDTSQELWTEMQEQMTKSQIRASSNNTGSPLSVYRRHVVTASVFTILVKLT